MPQNSPMHLPDMLSFQVPGETKIQPPYHGKWVSTFEIQSHQANLDKFYGWMSPVAGWQRQHLAWEQLSTSVPLGMTDGREQTPALSPAEQRCSWPGSAAVYTTPQSYCHNLWSWFFSRSGKSVESKEMLKSQTSWSNIWSSVSEIIFSSGSISSMFSPDCTGWWQQGLEKRGLEEICLLKHPWGPKREARIAFMLCGRPWLCPRHRGCYLHGESCSPPQQGWSWFWLQICPHQW